MIHSFSLTLLILCLFALHYTILGKFLLVNYWDKNLKSGGLHF